MVSILFDLEGRIPATPEELSVMLQNKTVTELEEMLAEVDKDSVEARVLEVALDRRQNHRAIP